MKTYIDDSLACIILFTTLLESFFVQAKNAVNLLCGEDINIIQCYVILRITVKNSKHFVVCQELYNVQSDQNFESKKVRENTENNKFYFIQLQNNSISVVCLFF